MAFFLLSTAIASVLLLVGCEADDRPLGPLRAEMRVCDARHNAGLVSLDDAGRFLVDGETWVPQGACSYPLLEHAGNLRMAEVRDVFAQAEALGRTVVRTNAFFDGGDNRARLRNDDGSMNEAGLVGLDRLLDAAREARVKLILVLANYWTDYGGIDAVLRSVAPGETPARDAFWTDSRAIEAQQRYITALVTRVNTLSSQTYAEDTTIFAWELVNEARCEDRSACDAATLVTWAQVMTDSVRAAGAQQLVAWGGAGHAGEHGEDFEAMAASGAVDVLTLHVYPESTQPELLVGLHAANRARVGAAIGSATITDRARMARKFARPLIVEELGWHPANGDAADHERAWVMAQWMATAQQESVGTLPWMIAEHAREDYDGLLIRPWQDAETAAVLGCSESLP